MEQEKKEEPAQAEQQQRRLVITTDGQRWQIGKETNVSPLEIKEICREIIMSLGG